ncbi:RHS repeat-associated core domain-containing protein [Reinekea sp. G2M2-21]|uniref:RHS repeat-associated core domain-containing protein n=1 Tax=Reinekea sp. G2M2-21 TaxID=2788942 RepID=UPI001E4C67AC|nr:RHS repeat-associated core domain-containing protein [Reinekea sp. G2M2-21]
MIRSIKTLLLTLFLSQVGVLAFGHGYNIRHVHILSNYFEALLECTDRKSAYEAVYLYNKYACNYLPNFSSLDDGIHGYVALALVETNLNITDHYFAYPDPNHNDETDSRYSSEASALNACNSDLTKIKKSYSNKSRVGDYYCKKHSDSKSEYYDHEYFGELTCKHHYRFNFNTSPTISIQSPANDSQYYNNRDITFRATAGDAEDGNKDYYIQWSIGGTVVESNKPYFTKAFEAGAYTVTASVTDTGGLSASASHQFEVNEHGIVLSNINVDIPDDHEAYMPVSFSVSTATIDDNDSKHLVRWFVDSNDVATGGSYTTVLAEGSHNIRAELSMDGNTAVKSTTVEILPSTPKLEIASPRGGQIFDIKESISFDASVYFKGSVLADAAISWQSDLAGSLGSTKQFSLSGLEEGLHSITATTTVEGETTSRNFVITIYDSEKNMGDQNDGQCFGGNPINLITGNKYHSEVDFSTKTEMPLHIKRSYNSTSKSVGLFGYGWSSNIEERVDYDAEAEQASVVSDTGAVQRFDFTAGQWVDESSNLGTLSRNSDGTWVYTLFNGTVKKYEQSGKITQVTALTGLSLTYTYESGRLSSIQDSFGNAITFTHNGSGFIESFTDPDSFTFTYSYENSNLTSVTYPDETENVQTDNPKKHYLYENTDYPHALTGLLDEESIRFATWQYDAEGRANFSKHGADVEEFNIAYNADGSVTTTNALGKKTTYWYESIKGILKVTGVTGHQSANCAATYAETKYDPETGFANEKIDWRGNRVLLVTNQYGQVESTTVIDTGAGWTGTIDERVTTTVEYNALRLPYITTKPGLQIVSDYTPEGRIDAITSTDTTTHVLPYSTNGQQRIVDYGYEYYPDSKVIKKITIDGSRVDLSDITTLEYNSQGLLSQSSNALNHAIEYRDYNSRGLPGTIIEQNGIEVSYEYWPRGWLKSQTVKYSQGSATTSYSYYKNGLLKSKTSPDGSSLTYVYNDARQLDYILNNLGEKQNFEPNKLNGDWTKLQYVDSAGSVRFEQSRLFDEMGRVREITSPEGHQTILKRDSSGNITSRITPEEDGLGFETIVQDSTYDVFNRVRMESTRPYLSLRALGDAPVVASTYYTYDEAGNLVEVDRPIKINSGRTTVHQKTTFVYNGFGEVIQQQSPATGTTIYKLDSAGNVVEELNSENQKTVKTYDALNRLKTVRPTGASAENVDLTYDEGLFGIGHLTTIEDQSGAQTLTYDEQGLIDVIDYTINNRLYSIDYDYNTVGQLEAIHYPSGKTVEYGFDVLGRANEVSISGAGVVAKTIVSDVTYLPFGPIESLSFGNQSTRHVSYNKSYRPTTLTHGWLTEDEVIQYGYDTADRITSQSRSIINADRTTLWDAKSYEYDIGSRLTATRWTKSHGKSLSNNEYLEFDYDSFGNRIAKRGRSQTFNNLTESWAYSIAPTNNQIEDINKSVNDGAYALTNSYEYFGTGQTKTDGQKNYVYNRSQRLTQVKNGAAVIGTYSYNASGLRVSKVANGAETHFHYNLAGQLIAESNSSGQAIREYAYLGGMPVAMLTGSDAYTGVASTSQTLVGSTEFQLDAGKNAESTSLMRITGNHEISAKLTDLSRNSGKEAYGLTLREQQDGLSGAKITAAFTATNSSTVNMLTVKTPEGKIVPIPMFSKSTSNEKLEVSIVYAGGTTKTDSFERTGDWVKLERNAQFVTVLTSVDGINWTTVREYNLPTTDEAYVGAVAENTKAEIETRFTAANDNLFYLHSDHLGAVYAVTSNSTKSKVWQRRDFEVGASPFGLNLLASGEKLHDGLFEMPLRFPGQYFDKETGTHYNYHRDYDPSLGRYIQSDPIGLNGGLNTYAYAYQSPLMYTDPTGEIVPLLIWAGAALWSAAEVAMSAYDIYDTGRTLLDPCVGLGAKIVAVGLVGAGFILPGGGYSKLDDLGNVANTAGSAADAALAAGKKSGAAAELRVGDKVFTGVSGEKVAHNPQVTGALMGTPASARKPWHGGCAEIVCLDKALNAGVNPAGGTMKAVNIGVSGKGHRTPKKICSSCNDVLDHFGVNK